MRRSLIVTIGVLVILNLILLAPVEAADSGFSTNSFGSSTATTKQLKWSGVLELDTRAILDKNGKSEIYTLPSLDLELNYTNSNSEIQTELNFNDNQTEVEEAFLRLYYDNFDLVVGKKKEVWGKGDKLHVVDNLNGEDLTDFINQDYLDRKIAEEMMKLNYYLGTGTLEAVYTPGFTPDRLAREGNWVTSKMELFNQAGNILKNYGNISDVVLASELSNKLKSNYNQLEDGQLGLRYTNSQGGYDYGFSLYQGRMREPSINIKSLGLIKEGVKEKDTTKIKQGLQGINLHYDEVTVLGTEASSVIAGINSRAELAYYLTDDTNGDNATVHNNKVAWLIGGDRDLALHNLNLNLQIKSEYILDNEKIEDNPLDIEYNQDNNYFTNLVSLKISDEFKNQRVLPSFALAYNLETDDYYLDNELELKLKDDTSLKFNYRLFSGDTDTDFGQFDKNDYLSANFNYNF